MSNERNILVKLIVRVITGSFLIDVQEYFYLNNNKFLIQMPLSTTTERIWDYWKQYDNDSIYVFSMKIN